MWRYWWSCFLQRRHVVSSLDLDSAAQQAMKQSCVPISCTDPTRLLLPIMLLWPEVACLAPAQAADCSMQLHKLLTYHTVLSCVVWFPMHLQRPQERISFNPHPKTLTMAGDYEYFAAQGYHPLAFALAELIDNSLRATKGNREAPRSLAVSLVTDDAGSRGMVCVRDNGSGMSTRELNNWAVMNLSMEDRGLLNTANDDKGDAAHKARLACGNSTLKQGFVRLSIAFDHQHCCHLLLVIGSLCMHRAQPKRTPTCSLL